MAVSPQLARLPCSDQHVWTMEHCKMHQQQNAFAPAAATVSVALCCPSTGVLLRPPYTEVIGSLAHACRTSHRSAASCSNVMDDQPAVGARLAVLEDPALPPDQILEAFRRAAECEALVVFHALRVASRSLRTA